MKVFLGGTCNNSQWRFDIKITLEAIGINYFDPVVEDWTEEAQANELRERKDCDFCLYVITPAMKSVYSIAEAVDDSNKRPEKTIFAFYNDQAIYRDDFDVSGKGFDGATVKSLHAVGKLIESNGAEYFNRPKDIIDFLKGQDNG